MPRLIRSEAELRAFAEEHLEYEVHMLLSAANGLAQANHSQFVNNAFLECFTIHLRALIDFLWDPANLHEDDAIASDFFKTSKGWEDIRPEFPLNLEPARCRTNKEIAHLTYARMDVTPEIKVWNFAKMTAAIVPVLKLFVENADSSRIGTALKDLRSPT